MVKTSEPAQKREEPVTMRSTSLATRHNKQMQGDHPVGSPGQMSGLLRCWE